MSIQLLNKLLTITILSGSLFTTACNGNKNDKQNTNQADTPVKKNNTDKNSIDKTVAAKPPIINITDTLSTKKTVLVIKDSAATQERISIKLAEIFGTKLQDVIKKNNVKIIGPPMAWYQTQKAPFFFEAGFAVDKKPTQLSPQMKIKEIGIDSIVVVHFYGPYHLTAMAYEAVNERMKLNKKKPAGAPYEIYVTDPIDKDGKPVDPYRVQTDIVFPIK